MIHHFQGARFWDSRFSSLIIIFQNPLPSPVHHHWKSSPSRKAIITAPPSNPHHLLLPLNRTTILPKLSADHPCHSSLNRALIKLAHPLIPSQNHPPKLHQLPLVHHSSANNPHGTFIHHQ
ncbi:hypothetical protein V6N13_133492 [Hibiscus sabdariffa]